MKLLFVGDVVAATGRRWLGRALPELRRSLAPDLVVVNGENAAGGAGMTPATCDELRRAGADVITSGNHVWDRREIVPRLDADERVLRPANYPGPAPGSGSCVVEAACGTPVAVLNLMGRAFLPDVDDPFRAADALLPALRERAAIVVIDFHAEATSEKIAFGWHVDGRASAVIGTHTHVPTADARILPGGTAYLTDVGMTGPRDGVIGVEKELALERFRTQRPVRLAPASGPARLDAAVVEIDPDGRAVSIEPVRRSEE